MKPNMKQHIAIAAAREGLMQQVCTVRGQGARVDPCDISIVSRYVYLFKYYVCIHYTYTLKICDSYSL